MKRVFFIILGIIFITSCGEVIPKPDPSPQPDYTESCSDLPERAELENAEANAFEIKLACLIKNHPDQQRPTMSYHPLLGEVARMRAKDMAEYGYYGKPDAHVDRFGYGPNYYVCLSGYRADFCPVGDSVRSNYVEIITYGTGESRSSPEKALNGWLNSPGHRISVLAETESRQERIYYGVGHAYTHSSPDYPDTSAHYWVFISTRPPLDE
jgi:uncharacterized protein YkwD